MGTIALGLVGGLLASKLLFRARFRRHRHHFSRRWRGDAPAPSTALTVDTPRRLHTLLPRLELNQRQLEEAREAFAEVEMALGERWRTWSGLAFALQAIAAEPFDIALAREALGPLDDAPERAALDALEHVHNILTPEQRAFLASDAHAGGQVEA